MLIGIKKRIKTVLLIIVCILFVDHTTKYLVNHFLHFTNLEMYTVTGFLNLVQVHNSGISFGLLQQPHYKRFIFIIVSLVIITMFITLVIKTKTQQIIYPVALILGGAIGNLMDRMLSGAVFDFLDFHIREYHFPVFNFADTMVVIGAIWFLIVEVREAKHEHEK